MIRKNSASVKSVARNKSQKQTSIKPIPSHTQRNQNLLLSLNSLKMSARETTHAWSTDLLSELSLIIDEIKEVLADEDKCNNPEMDKLIKNIFRLLDTLKLKPEKGRWKDIKNLHETVKSLGRLSHLLDG